MVLHLLRYRKDNKADETLHPRYYIGSVRYTGTVEESTHLRKKVLDDNTIIEEGWPYSAKALQRTYYNFARLGALGYTNISFTERSDTTLLDCVIHTSRRKLNSIIFQPEGTNTAGNLGAAVKRIKSALNL